MYNTRLHYLQICIARHDDRASTNIEYRWIVLQKL